MINTIEKPFAASAAQKTETEKPEKHCLVIQGSGSG